MSENVQKDLVLSINEFAYVLDKTKGNVTCWVGPVKTSLSTQDALVQFDNASKRFVECSMNQAIKLFITAPENWYAILKNPTKNGNFPKTGNSSNIPEDGLDIGRKVNITGPVSFALYPGQMAKVIKGHTIRSNQYLLARVYDADSANKNRGIVMDPEGLNAEEKTESKNYINGQILVIKGTEVSFYIPPTGIEVIPINNEDRKGYVREAVTLERLEYCILKDEDGNKRYMHGPDVVFPEPTETFVTSPKGGFIFKAIELSKISGVYVKVIAEYTDDKQVVHPIGEELFITGDQQMIYYPRPEHAIISYDGKILHHAIAIPAGEGRYVLNRLTGEIETVKGPKMYLPDPRTQVIVKRKLTAKQCELMYPGNQEALAYNLSLSEKSVEKMMNAASKGVSLDSFTAFCSTSREDDTLAYMEANANISRGTSYTKPRTITLDNKYDGVVSVDVWTGYAVNVISKNGDRKVVCGPQTILLDYDQTFEEVQMSTGRPKNTDHLLKSLFLHHENNKVSDIISIETKDFVRADIKVSYCVDFDKDCIDKWFNVENYVKYLCDRERSIIKREAKKYTIEEFYQNYSQIIHDIAVNYNKNTDANAKKRHIGRFFPENGMYVHDCEVLQISVEDSVSSLLTDHQYEMVEKSLELSDAEKRIQIAEKLAEAEKKEFDVKSQTLIHKMELQREEAVQKLTMQAEVNRKNEAEKAAAKQAEKDMQPIIDAIEDAALARAKRAEDMELETKRAEAEIEKAKQEAYAQTVEKIMSSISPDLIAAMTSSANSQMLEVVAKNMSPYAIAKGESVADTLNTLMRGTTLEKVVEQMAKKPE